MWALLWLLQLLRLLGRRRRLMWLLRWRLRLRLPKHPRVVSVRRRLHSHPRAACGRWRAPLRGNNTRRGTSIRGSIAGRGLARPPPPQPAALGLALPALRQRVEDLVESLKIVFLRAAYGGLSGAARGPQTATAALRIAQGGLWSEEERVEDLVENTSIAVLRASWGGRPRPRTCHCCFQERAGAARASK